MSLTATVRWLSALQFLPSRMWSAFGTWSRRLLGRQPSTLLDAATKRHLVYEGKPVWWARWTWPLVGMDLFLCSSMAETAWNHWTWPDPAQKELAGEDAHVQPNYVLRPAWQRFALAAGQFAVGLGFASALVRLRGRAVRRVYIVPSPSHSAQVFIQTPVHGASSGIRTTLGECRLSPGRDMSEVILRLRGREGEYWMELRGARIRGQEVPLERANAEIWEAFTGKKAAAMQRWKSGPVLQG
ncbi:hypothetical protein GLOTRDRAFT_138839 [Gloeophyllum trabeum ATCC 11539]|uniref:Uncharacterized protein n=1 Tax=Gloeophyllum trabeum (strain ATCC 11539 / FP-39264 / Madison 617) TaxID=670483 RepID=S7Q6R3_GLOTA|nr:uncharacterized protein GLOTRDRAFT_138839 [Gloeophyllum trabeum ATCC 11539]EPQ55217.1 hypothetical protein GLOTRDRAFT_138839 [Gloeophyllum trabeum ATCC 11539]